MNELNQHGYAVTPEIQKNLDKLLDAMNKIRLAYNKPMMITSGLRSEAQQEALIKAGQSNAPKSKHLIGAAADVYDKDGELYRWCKDHTKDLEAAGLWCEERQGPWQHFQIYPPRSGKRWFFP